MSAWTHSTNAELRGEPFRKIDLHRIHPAELPQIQLKPLLSVGALGLPPGLHVLVHRIPCGLFLTGCRNLACVSGLRVFGLAQGEKPKLPRKVKAERTGDLEMKVSWEGDGTGYEVLWGHAEDKLYHS